MAKLSPEKKAARAEKFRRTMAAKKAARSEQGDLIPVAAADVLAAKSVAEVLARRPLAMARTLPREDPRLTLAGDIVRLLARVLQ